MNVVLASFGTDGDVVPYIGLGIRLRACGHQVTLAANEPYRDLATHYGLNFRALVSREDTEAFLNNPDLWHPLRSLAVGYNWLARSIPAHFELLDELSRPPGTVTVASSALLSARVVQDQFGRPLVGMILQPWMIASVDDPPVMPAGLTLPRWAPRPLGRLYWRITDLVGAWVLGRHVNRLRAGLGLRPVRRVFQWCLAPDLVLGMFPDWYARPQPDWPRQIRLAGFPRFDGGRSEHLPEEVARFCRAGAPPVAFTFGSGMRHGAALFRTALEACKLLGVRAIFLSKHLPQLPVALPEWAGAFEFAPFSALFPQCAAVVHHGGIGTTARVLAAGTPQLILPFAWDQRDNARRVQRLGAGDQLGPARSQSKHLAAALGKLLTGTSRDRCQAVRDKMTGQDGLENAVRWIEDLKP